MNQTQRTRVRVIVSGRCHSKTDVLMSLKLVYLWFVLSLALEYHLARENNVGIIIHYVTTTPKRMQEESILVAEKDCNRIWLHSHEGCLCFESYGSV